MNRFSKLMTVLLLVFLSDHTFADELRSIGFGASNSSWGVVSKSILDFHGVPKAAIEKMKKVIEDGGAIRGIGFTPDGGWGVTYATKYENKIYWIARNVPQEAIDYMNKRSQDNAQVLDMAFGPNNSWFVLTQKNDALEWRYKGVPDELANYLATFSGGDGILKGVGLTSHSGWTVISKTKSGEYFAKYKGIPQEAADKLGDILNANDEEWNFNL